MSIIDSLAAASRIMDQLVIDQAVSLCEGTDFDMVVPHPCRRRIFYKISGITDRHRGRRAFNQFIRYGAI